MTEMVFRIPVDIDWDEGEWFECPVEGFRGARFRLRYNYPDKVGEILKRNTTLIRGRAGEERDVDGDGVGLDTYDWIIQGWDGLADKDGKALPCTRENKSKLVGRFKSVDKWIWSVGHDEQTIARVKLERLEAEKKISATG